MAISSKKVDAYVSSDEAKDEHSVDCGRLWKGHFGFLETI